MAEQDRLKELAQEYLRLRQRKKDTEQELEDIKAEIDQCSASMKPILEGLEAQNVKLTGIGTVFLQTRFYVSALKDQKEALMQWLDDHQLGSLAKRDIHSKTLTSEYNRWMDEDLPVPPPELVSAFPKTEVRIRASKGD